MKILITDIDPRPEFFGGIKRVSSILGNEWKLNHSVSFLSFCTSSLHFESFASIPQYFLPDSEQMNSKENLEFFSEFVSKYSIDIILNQFGGDGPMSDLCIKVKQRTNVKLVSVLHFAVTHEEDVVKSAFFAPLKMRYPFSGKGRMKTVVNEILFSLNYHLRNKNLKKKLFKDTIKEIYNSSDAFVLLSESQKDIFLQYIGSDNSSKLYAINNPICLEEGQIHGNELKRKHILWCGRIEYGQKRLDRMIEIWKEIAFEYPDWELMIIGGGNIDYFKNIIQHEKIPNVHFTGFINPDEVYSTGSIFCMTSSSEGWGMVLVEAMKHGCVPIAYDSFTALGDIIQEGYNGFKIPPYRKGLFIRQLKTLMVNENLRNQLSVNGRNFVRHFDKKIIAEQWLDLFKQLLSS
ncbi:MAG: glycosyltransferase [Tannerella sp.]|jgi:glycosyltransferase involved in cell wall biosynthesis|nr:glycosyltransferase [Tannerella sp.]